MPPDSIDKDLFAADNKASVLKLLVDLKATGERIESTLATHIQEDAKALGHLMSAFPAGDADGHRRYHEAQIEWINTKNRLIKECIEKGIKFGIIFGAIYIFKAVAIAALGDLYHYLTTKP